MSVGERINELRKQHNLSQVQLAKALGISRQAVSKWENDQSLPDTLMMIQLADLLKTDSEYLATGRHSQLNKPPTVITMVQKVDHVVEKIVEKPVEVEKIIEVEPDMSQIGPTFKKDAGKIIGYLKSTDIDEIGSVLEENNELRIGDIVVPGDMLNIKKEIVGASGKKVDILQSEKLDMIVEVIR